MQYLKSLYRNYALKIEQDIELDVQIIADDMYGTFSNTIVVADETGGIEIKLSGNDLFMDLQEGQNLRVRCLGLVLGSYGGVVQLGYPSNNPDYETGFIPSYQMAEHLNKTNKEIEYVLPEELTFEELQPRHVGCLVAFGDVQFVDEEVGLAWTENGEDTDRHLVNRNGQKLIVRTSRNALFAQFPLPEQSGYIEGILSYFNGNYQLRVYTQKNVFMDKQAAYWQPRFSAFRTNLLRSPAHATNPRAYLLTPVCDNQLRMR